MKQLLILSGKGGTGKTTMAGAFIRLAEAKAYADCDVDAPNLHLSMKQDSPPVTTDFYGMDKAFIKQESCTRCGLCVRYCRFDAIVFRQREFHVDPYACEGCGVCVAVCPRGAIEMKPAISGDLLLYQDEAVFSTARLRMGSGHSGKLVTEVKKQMAEQANPETPLAIIDGLPGIGCPVIAALGGVDMALIVVEPSVSGISDMERIIKTADRFGTKMAVCINKYDTNSEQTQRIEAYCKEHNLPIAGKVPFDEDAVKAINQGLSIVDIDCTSGQAATEVFKQTMQILFPE